MQRMSNNSNNLCSIKTSLQNFLLHFLLVAIAHRQSLCANEHFIAFHGRDLVPGHNKRAVDAQEEQRQGLFDIGNFLVGNQGITDFKIMFEGK